MSARMLTRVIGLHRQFYAAHCDRLLVNGVNVLNRSLCVDNATNKDSSNTEIPEVSAIEKELTEANKELNAKFEETNDKYKRALAETENVRQRMKRQIDDAKKYGIQGFCKDLLDVADVLEKATISVPKEELNDKNPHLKNLFEGLQMTETQLQKVFKNHGLDKIDPLGEKFNPNLHEALFEHVDTEKEPGTVAVVTKIGYSLHERTLRPALVGVVKK